MRPSKHCPYFLPWVGTDKGEIEDVCIDPKTRFTKKCSDCIKHQPTPDKLFHVKHQQNGKSEPIGDS